MPKPPKTARELYGEAVDDPWYIDNYWPIVQSFGSVAVETEDGSCQGSSLVLYHDKDSDCFSVLEFDWGSCSGCDALQACNTEMEIDQLIQELFDSLKVFSRAQFLEWLTTHDFEGSCDREFQLRFKKACEEYVIDGKGVCHA